MAEKIKAHLMATTNCSYCGVFFEVKKAKLDRGLGRYCSQLCVRRANAGNRRGATTPPETRDKLSVTTKLSWLVPDVRIKRLEGKKKAQQEGRGNKKGFCRQHKAESRHKMGVAKKGKAPWNKGLSLPFLPRPWMLGRVPWNKGMKGFRAGEKRDTKWRQKILEGVLRSVKIKPNKAEILLANILEKHFPCQWRYTGDGQVIIGPHNPDFTNVNGKKLVIELFGEHWHKSDEVPALEADYLEFGFNALVVWYRSELQRLGEEYVVQKIRRWVHEQDKSALIGIA